MNMKWIVGASIAVAVAAVVVAVLRNQAADTATARVTQLEAESQKAQADVKAARAERDAQGKEAARLTQEAQQLRSAADTATQFLEVERAMSTRLREDLAMASARLAATGTRPPRQADALPPGILPPGIVQIQRPAPVVVRAVPSGTTAVGAGVPAK
jgi:hypothetical protein